VTVQAGGGSTADPTDVGELRAVDRAEALLVAAGFTVSPRSRRKANRVDATLVAQDARGNDWLVDVVGALTVAPSGLRRVDVLERTLGRAARLSGFGARRLLVLSTDLPSKRSGLAAALAGSRGRLLVDVLPLWHPAAPARLRAYAEAPGEPAPIGGLLTPD
jgi:hypothetical protein